MWFTAKTSGQETEMNDKAFSLKKLWIMHVKSKLKSVQNNGLYIIIEGSKLLVINIVHQYSHWYMWKNCLRIIEFFKTIGRSCEA